MTGTPDIALGFYPAEKDLVFEAEVVPRLFALCSSFDEQRVFCSIGHIYFIKVQEYLLPLLYEQVTKRIANIIDYVIYTEKERKEK